MPIRYVPYEPSTVQGQAVVNNIARSQRLLTYRDNDKIYHKIRKGMPYYEVDTIEKVGLESENMLIRGECVSACAYLKDQNINVDMAYLDFPFSSGANYAKKIFIRQNPEISKKIKKKNLELDFDELRSFEEEMYGDIWKKEDYLNWMYENLLAIRTVLSENASIYIHLDSNIVHYVKVVADEIFPDYEFSEIIWVCGLLGSGKRYPKSHESILYYYKDESIFNPPHRIGYSKRITNALIKDDGGWYYTRGKESSGGDNYLKTYICNNPNLTKKEAIEYASEKRPQTVWDVWMGKEDLAKAFNDHGVGTYAFKEKESTGYATQKPDELLKRIIEASSDKGMIIADFFGGSGTTAKAANDLDRCFIHVDVGINSIQTTRDRLIKNKASFTILDIKDGVHLFRNPVQTMNKLAKLIPGLQQAVTGLNDFWFGYISDTKYGTVPVYIPNLQDSSSKVFDIPMANRIINQEIQKLDDDVKKIIAYYIDIDNYDKTTEFIRKNNPTTAVIELKDLKNLLDNIVVEDIAEFEIKEKNGFFEVIISKFYSDTLIRKIKEFNYKGKLQQTKTKKKFKPIKIDNGLELIEFISLDCTNKKGIWKSDIEIFIDKVGYAVENGAERKHLWDGKIKSEKKPFRMKIRNISGDESYWDLSKCN